MDAETMEQFARVVITERPGITSAALGDTLGLTLTARELDALHRYGRAYGIGQDDAGAWFTVQDSAVIADAYLTARRTPGADSFFATRDAANEADWLREVAAIRAAVVDSSRALEEAGDDVIREAEEATRQAAEEDRL